MANMIYLDYEVLGLDTNKSDINELIVTNYIIDNNIQISRGDIIKTIKGSFRNDGILIWTGNKARF